MKLSEQINYNIDKLFPLELYDGTKVRMLSVYIIGSKVFDLEAITGRIYYGVPKQDIKGIL